VKIVAPRRANVYYISEPERFSADSTLGVNMLLPALREQVLDANLELVRRGHIQDD
jgi:hypothetical protein